MTERISQQILSGGLNGMRSENVGGINMDRAREFFGLVKDERKGMYEFTLANNMQSAAVMGSWNEVLRAIMVLCAYDIPLSENTIDTGLGILAQLGPINLELEGLKEGKWLNDLDVRRLEERLEAFEIKNKK